ncbi:MAG: hypothetical protein SOX74_07180 [Candidatus Faecousia sp.]|uniref:hypothetical protein n=1 Tax=Faecousia sp. TaxID=2952921 RepID=UPI002A8D883A|nr:hypothetical protein [Candidatus Faecousia sp.]
MERALFARNSARFVADAIYEMIQRLLREPLNKSAAAVSGSFAPTDRFENLEIRKGFLRFPNLNLEQNPSLTTLAI